LLRTKRDTEKTENKDKNRNIKYKKYIHIPESPKAQVGSCVGDSSQYKLDGMNHLVHQHLTKLKLLTINLVLLPLI
jgi:hypothetical protein